MDEVEIRIDVNSDPAIAGIEKLKAELRTLDDESKKLSDNERKRAQEDAKNRKVAQRAIQDYGRASQEVYRKQASSERDRSKSTQQLIGELRKQRDETLRAAGYTTDTLAKEEAKRSKTAEAEWKKRAATEKRYQSQMLAERVRSDARMAAQEKAANDRSMREDQRIKEFRSRLYREMYDDRVKRAEAADNAMERMQQREQARGQRMAADRNAAHAHQNKLLEQEARLRKNAELDEEQALKRRTSNWQRFYNDIARASGRGGGRGGGGGFFTNRGGDDGRGPVRRNQFSRNPFLDLGGRGAQPRTLGIAALVGLGAAGAGPLGAAAGGLLGAVPGAMTGVASAIAAIKMSGITQVAKEAAKIRNLQAEIATGAIKEAKGRAQIAAILKQMTPEQKKAMALWQGFYDVSQKIGRQVSQVLLPAFGDVGKAISANSGVISNSIVTAGKAMAGFMTTMSQFISKGPGKQLFAGDMAAGNTFIKGLMKSVGDLGKSFFAVGSASQVFMKQLMGMANGVTGAFAKWTTSKSGQNDLKTFFSVAIKEIPIVIGLFRDLGKVLFTVLKAALPFANELVVGLSHALQSFNKFLQSARGQEAMKNLFDGIRSAVQGAIEIIRTLWPVVSAVFSKISSAEKALSSTFGNGFAVATTLMGAMFMKNVVAVVTGGVSKILKNLTKMAITNPWVVAIAGTALFIAWLSHAQTAMDILKTKANDAANQIKGVFQAINSKGNTQLDLKELKLQQGMQSGSIFSQKQKIASLQQRRDDAVASGKGGLAQNLSNQVKQAQLSLARLQHSYRDTTTSIADANQKVQTYNQKIAAGTTKAASDVKKAWESASKASRQTVLFGGRGGPQGSLKPIDTANITAAKKAFQDVFQSIGFGSDSASKRATLAMQKINGILQATGKIPTKKQISFIIHNLASKTIANILTQLGKIHDKNFRITPTNANKTLMDIKAINQAPIADKHFSIIGKYSIPASPLIPATQNPSLQSGAAGGGILPGVGGHDTIHAMLRPGEVVLNRSQQYDFGGPEVFKNYFGSQTNTTHHYAKGGVVQATRVIGDGSLAIGKKGQVIGGTGTGAGFMPAITNPVGGGTTLVPAGPTGPAEPGWQSVVNLLRNQAPAIKLWTQKVHDETILWNYFHDKILHDDYDKRTNLNTAEDKLVGDKSKSATATRKVLHGKQATLARKIRVDQQAMRHSAERLSADKRHLHTSKKVYSHIPGWDAFQGQLNAAEVQETALSYVAAQMPMLDPNANPNAPNGINTLTNDWNSYNTQFVAAGNAERDAIQTRVNWLIGDLIPGLKNRPLYTSVANNEVGDDQRQMLSILGKSLADTIPSGVGPGDTITGAGSGGGAGSTDTWADQLSTKVFGGQLSQFAADAAYALISNNPTGWMNAMTTERDTVWTRIQQLQGARDFEPFAPFRNDILDEITSDSGTYSSVVSAIQAGFAAAQGSDAGSNDAHTQDVINSANEIMSQINLGSTVEREQLGLLSDYLRGQVPSHEVGAQYVGKTGLAMIHQGERITPRGDHTGGYGPADFTIRGSDALTRMIAKHIEPHITYTQGQSARRKSRERRR